MVAFTHVISSPQGLHARPVAQICRVALDHVSDITLTVGDTVARASDMIALMALDARRGDTVEVLVEGADEQEAAEMLRGIFSESL